MLARIGMLSLALSCITNGLDLDVNSQGTLHLTHVHKFQSKFF